MSDQSHLQDLEVARRGDVEAMRLTLKVMSRDTYIHGLGTLVQPPFSKSIITAKCGSKVEEEMVLKKAEVTRAKGGSKGFAATSG